MNTLNKTFVANRTLRAAELNSIVSKINEIIANFPSDESSSDPVDSVTEQDVIDKVNAAKAQLQSLIDQMNASIGTLIVKVEGLEEGMTTVDGKEEFLRAIRQQCNIVLLDLNVAKKIIRDGEEVIVPAVDLGVLQQDVNALNTLYAGLSALPGQVGLIANHFDEQGNPIYDGAAIIASINDNGDSTVGINANKVIIEGDTLVKKLTSLDADIQNINVPDTATIANAVIQQLDVPNEATIKSAVIQDIEAGNVTITGDLHYNRMIGNSKTVSTSAVLSNSDYFVQVNNSNSSNYITITLPSTDLATGQTVFIDCGSGYFNLKCAGKPIKYFYAHPVMASGVSGSITGYEVWEATAGAGDDIDAHNAGWNCVIQFIYTGTQWQQLIHNIRS